MPLFAGAEEEESFLAHGHRAGPGACGNGLSHGKLAVLKLIVGGRVLGMLARQAAFLARGHLVYPHAPVIFLREEQKPGEIAQRLAEGVALHAIEGIRCSAGRAFGGGRRGRRSQGRVGGGIGRRLRAAMEQQRADEVGNGEHKPARGQLGHEAKRKRGRRNRGLAYHKHTIVCLIKSVY